MKTNLFHNNINEMAIQRVYYDVDLQLSTIDEAKEQLKLIFDTSFREIAAKYLPEINFILTKYPELINTNLTLSKYATPRSPAFLIFNMLQTTLLTNKQFKRLLKTVIKNSDNLEIDTSTARRNVTPLMLIATIDDKELIELITSRDVNLNAQNKSDETPLFYAIRHNIPYNVQLLLSLGADPSIKNNQGQTPRTFALRQGLDECYSILTNYNAPLGF